MQSVYSRFTAMCSGCTPAKKKNTRRRDTRRRTHARGRPAHRPTAACVAWGRGGGARARRRTVAIGRVDVGFPLDQKFRQLNKPTRQRVVQRRAAAAVLPIIGVSTRLHEAGGNAEAGVRVVGRVALAGGDLVQATIKVCLCATCARSAEWDCIQWRDWLVAHGCGGGAPSATIWSTTSTSSSRIARIMPSVSNDIARWSSRRA